MNSGLVRFSRKASRFLSLLILACLAPLAVSASEASFEPFSLELQSVRTRIEPPQYKPAFPKGPAPTLTPGSLCAKPSSKRYAEGIPYCERDVDSELKREVMENYDRQLGYRVLQMDRGLFKIDHFIPLCMGGSNNEDNLWPQHESVYQITDRLEAEACNKMAQGKLLQSKAVEWIREAKLDLSKAPEVLSRVLAL